MRTNIDIEDSLMKEALSVSQFKTKKDLVEESLRIYVRLKKQKDLSELAGSIEFHNGYDHKKLRRTRA